MNKNEESPFQLALRPESSLVREESPYIGRLRRSLRLDFKRDTKIIGILSSNATPEEQSEKIADYIHDRFEHVTAEDIRRESLLLIQENLKLRDMGVGEIVVDSAGKAVVPMTGSTVYYPTRIDEHGNKSLGFPMLHPAIASELMLREVDSKEIERLERLSPVYAFNAQIEKTTEPLEIRIREDLEKLGWTIRSNFGNIYTEMVGKESKVKIFGKERNPAFSRVPIWSRLFVQSIPGPPRDIEFIAFDRREDDIHRWYEITYRASE